jgi:hypothetical protein
LRGGGCRRSPHCRPRASPMCARRSPRVVPSDDRECVVRFGKPACLRPALIAIQPPAILKRVTGKGRRVLHRTLLSRQRRVLGKQPAMRLLSLHHFSLNLHPLSLFNLSGRRPRPGRRLSQAGRLQHRQHRQPGPVLRRLVRRERRERMRERAVHHLISRSLSSFSSLLSSPLPLPSLPTAPSTRTARAGSSAPSPRGAAGGAPGTRTCTAGWRRPSLTNWGTTLLYPSRARGPSAWAACPTGGRPACAR